MASDLTFVLFTYIVFLDMLNCTKPDGRRSPADDGGDDGAAVGHGQGGHGGARDSKLSR